ncbi:MAG: co-chaperone DjlA [Luminiphilus sp.]|nr:co-chaperone DjlA [Luminiphilus sp.]
MKSIVAGKILGVFFGYITLGVAGALVGFFVGHLFDAGLWRAVRLSGPDGLRELQQEFFDTTFVLLGYVAKADGRVSEAEVAQAESLFAQLRLSPRQREAAISRFKQGASADFDVVRQLQLFRRVVLLRPATTQTLLLFLIGMALADGHLDSREREALSVIARSLGVSDSLLDRLISMVTAQSQFGQNAGGGKSYAPPKPRNQLSEAYQALGVSSSVSDGDLKRAYRKLMSENHPDKLSARGVPEEMIQMATERSQKISAAYDVIKESRGIR